MSTLKKFFYARDWSAEGWEWNLCEGSRGDAIEEAKRELGLSHGDTFAIARAEPMEDFLDIGGDIITKILHDAADVSVLDCEWPNLSSEQESELGDVVTKAIREYFAKNNLNHDFKAITDAEDVIA